MAKCPHGCTRCKVIEAGLGGRALTPRELVEVFGVAEVERERPPLAEDTQRAIAAAEVAQIAYEDAHRETGIALAGNRRHPDYADTVEAAFAEREDVQRHLARARALRHELTLRDQEAWRAERAQAEQVERAERKRAAREAELRRRQGLLDRVKTAVRGGRG